MLNTWTAGGRNESRKYTESWVVVQERGKAKEAHTPLQNVRSGQIDAPSDYFLCFLLKRQLLAV